MACNCATPNQISSWIDLQNYPPRSPFELIANAILNSTTGEYLNSTTYANPSAWIDSPFAVNGEPTVAALGSDNLQNVADAAQWNFTHETWNSSSKLAPPLQNVIFLRGRTHWQNNIPINFGSSSYVDIELSFLDNAATRGDYAGTYPVISWTGSFTGSVTLHLTVKTMGQVKLGLRAIDSSGNYSMFELICMIVS